MPQTQMPFFPEGAVHINALLAFTKANGHIAYVSGGMQLCTHPETDRTAFLINDQRPVLCERHNNPKRGRYSLRRPRFGDQTGSKIVSTRGSPWLF